jgi:hypothetical protein
MSNVLAKKEHLNKVFFCVKFSWLYNSAKFDLEQHIDFSIFCG